MPPTFRPQPQRYNAVAMALHWLIAAAVIFNIYVGLQWADAPRSPDKGHWMVLHMSVGFLVLILSLFRVVWRLTHQAPPPPRGLNPLLRIASVAVAHIFYLLIILVPLAGWLMVSTRGFQPEFFGLFPWPAFPGFSGLSEQAAHSLHETFENAHAALAWGFILLVPVHILAALYHHFGRGDNILLRMLPFTRLRDGM